jgi:hypothetical protein
VALVRFDTPWDSQPQEAVGVDWSNPLAASLGFLYDGASGRDVVGDLRFTGNRVQGVSRAGRGQFSETNGTTSRLASINPTRIQFQNITVFALFNPTANPGNDTLFFMRRMGTAEPSFGLGIHTGTFNGYRFALNGQTSDFYASPIANIGTVPFRPTFLAMTYNGSSLRCYVDGVDVGGGSGYGLIDYSRTDEGLQVFDGGVYQSSIGVLLLAGICSKDFSAHEIAQLSANPWQLFAPRQIWIPASGSISPVPTLSFPTAFNITASSFQPRVSYAF